MSSDLTCRQFVDFLDAYLEHEIVGDARTVFESHLGDCPPCRKYLKSYADTIKLARGACCDELNPPPKDVPEDLIKAVLAARAQQQSD